MGTIASTVQAIFGQKSRNIMMVGPSGAGKTTILYRLHLGKVVPTMATIGFNVETIEYKDFLFRLSDLRSGIFTRIWCNLYLKDTDAVVIVLDATDGEYDYEVRDLMDSCRECVLLILANKQDLPNSRTTDEITLKLKLDQYQHKRCHVQGTSAVHGTGFNEALDWLSKELSSSIR